MTFGRKIGFTTNVDNTKFAILENATTQNPSGEQVRIVSTSAQDSSSGTGIRKIKLSYFTNIWQEKSEIITLNGTTSVDSTNTDIYRIESFEAIETGNIFAVGTVTVKSLDGTKLYAQIDAGRTMFERALHYIPPNRFSEIIDILIGSTTSGGVAFIIFIDIDYTSQGGGIVISPEILATATNESVCIPIEVPILLDASNSSQGLRIGIVTRGLAASQNAFASFRFEDTIIT